MEFLLDGLGGRCWGNKCDFLFKDVFFLRGVLGKLCFFSMN